MSKKRIISGRVTRMQKMKLLVFMKEHPEVGHCHSLGPKTNRKTAQIWQSIGLELNGYGPEKTWEQWKKTWIDWKSSVKKLYIANKQFKTRTDIVPIEEVPKKLDSLGLAVLQFVRDKDRNFDYSPASSIVIRLASPIPVLDFEEVDDTMEDIKDPSLTAEFEECIFQGTEESLFNESMNDEAVLDDVKSEPKSCQISMSEESTAQALPQRRHDAFFQMAGEKLDQLAAEQQDEAKLFFLTYLHKQIYKKKDT